MTRSALTVRLLAAATLLLTSACGSTTTTPTASPTTTTSGAPASGGVLGVAKTSLGSVLVDSRGMTVYVLTADAPGQSTCSALCLDKWPLVSAPAGDVTSVPGVSALLGVTKATSGASMLTAGGSPLYTYSGDSAPGDTHGEGIEAYGGKWYAVSPSGVAVKGSLGSAPSSAPAPAPAVPGY
jgi:predicted lipoprotein with Yx(FWY)xxD motif